MPSTGLIRESGHFSDCSGCCRWSSTCSRRSVPPWVPSMRKTVLGPLRCSRSLGGRGLLPCCGLRSGCRCTSHGMAYDQSCRPSLRRLCARSSSCCAVPCNAEADALPWGGFFLPDASETLTHCALHAVKERQVSLGRRHKLCNFFGLIRIASRRVPPTPRKLDKKEKSGPTWSNQKLGGQIWPSLG